MNSILQLTPETMDRFIPTPPKTRKHPWYKVAKKESWLSYLNAGEKLPSVPKGVKKRGLEFDIQRGIDSVTGRNCARITRVK